MTSKLFSAWDGVFTDRQIQEIINMSLHADSYGVKLHAELQVNLPTTKIKSFGNGNGNGINKPLAKARSVASLKKACISKDCSGDMELFSVCCSESALKKQGYLTKWECNKCGKVEYSKQTLDEARKILMEGKNGTSK